MWVAWFPHKYGFMKLFVDRKYITIFIHKKIIGHCVRGLQRFSLVRILIDLENRGYKLLMLNLCFKLH